MNYLRIYFSIFVEIAAKALALQGLPSLRHFKDEILKRNKFDPVIKKERNIPYLVDQHLLDKKNA